MASPNFDDLDLTQVDNLPPLVKQPAGTGLGPKVADPATSSSHTTASQATASQATASQSTATQATSYASQLPPCGQRPPTLPSSGQAASAASSTGRPAAQPNLHDLPHPSLLGAGLVLIIDLKAVKHTHTREERAHFLLDDLKVPPGALAAAFVAPITAQFMVEFLPDWEAEYRLALRRLAEGVPWRAAGGRLVNGWAPGDALAAVRVVGVPAGLDHGHLTAVLSRHGRIVTGPTPGRDPLLLCPDGTVHFKMHFPDGHPPLPTFISVELDGFGGGPNFVLQVYTDTAQKRCYRCGGHHLGMLCKGQQRTITEQGDLWARIVVPGRTLPPPAPRSVPTPPPAAEAHGQAASGAAPAAQTAAAPFQPPAAPSGRGRGGTTAPRGGTGRGRGGSSQNGGGGGQHGGGGSQERGGRSTSRGRPPKTPSTRSPTPTRTLPKRKRAADPAAAADYLMSDSGDDGGGGT